VDPETTPDSDRTQLVGYLRELPKRALVQWIDQRLADEIADATREIRALKTLQEPPTVSDLFSWHPPTLANLYERQRAYSERPYGLRGRKRPPVEP
jgi:hypothetical protein